MIQSSTRPRQKYNTIDVLCFVHVSYLVISHPILQWLGYLYLSLVNSLWQTLGVGILLLYSIFIHIALKIVTCSLFINFSEAFSFQRSVNVKDDFAFWFFIWDMHYSSYWHRQFAIDCNPYNILIFFNEYWCELFKRFLVWFYFIKCVCFL